MNWYKKAQQKNSLSELLKGLSVGAIIGILGLLGLNSLKDLQNEYVKNPEYVEQKLTEYKKIAPDSNTQSLNHKSNNFNLQEVGKMIERHEGKRNTRYIDSKGIETIGIGFNLTRPDAKNKIEELGANYEDIRNGRASLTDKQIYKLFNDNLNESVGVAQSFLPNFNDYPSSVQSVVIDMAFNLGPNKLSGFKDFREALINKDYQTAAKEMVNSKWYRQVGNRSKELVNIMSNN